MSIIPPLPRFSGLFICMCLNPFFRLHGAGIASIPRSLLGDSDFLIRFMRGRCRCIAPRPLDIGFYDSVSRRWLHSPGTCLRRARP